MFQLVDNMTTTRLGEWIETEMQQRKMGLREFSRLVGVSHSTLDRIVNPQKEEDEYPSVKTLLKMAEATHTDLCSLVALIAPHRTNVDVEARLLAERISRLPKDKQEIVNTFIFGLILKGGD